MISSKSKDDILFRCSSLGDLMSDGRGATRAEKLEKKRAEIRDEEAKIAADIENKKAHLKPHAARLEKVARLNAELQTINDTPDVPEERLGDTAKSRCRSVVLEQIYGALEETESDATRHGKQWESSAILQFGELIGVNVDNQHLRFNKNWKREYIEFGTGNSKFTLTGEPDVIFDNTIWEFKCPFSVLSYDAQTRQAVQDYLLQVQGYMLLFGLDRAVIVTALFRNKNIKSDEFCKDTPRALRFHQHVVERDDHQITQIVERLQLCAEWSREYRDGFRKNKGFYLYKDYRQKYLNL